jgi:hypothetical protein
VILAALLACASVPAPVSTESVPCDYCGGDCVDETQTITSAQHVTGDVVYDDVPPTSGDHNACWADWGVHTEDPGDEHWVHNEEHGGVVFLYQPASCAASDSGEDCAADVAALAAVLDVASDPRWVITPYAPLPSAWAAVAWGHRWLMGCFDLGAMNAFFVENVGHGSEDLTTDPSESCM